MDAKILIVDDDEMDRKALSRCLKRAGFPSSDFALNAEEAIAKLKSLPPSLILVDIGLIGRDGFYVCEKALEICPQIPVILLSGLIDGAKKELAYEKGAVGCFEKSVNYADLIAFIEEIMDA